MQTFGWGSGVESLGHLVPMRYRFAFVAAAFRNLILCPKLALGGERGDNRFRMVFNLRSLKTSLVCNLKDNNIILHWWIRFESWPQVKVKLCKNINKKLIRGLADKSGHGQALGRTYAVSGVWLTSLSIPCSGRRMMNSKDVQANPTELGHWFIPFLERFTWHESC